MKNLIFIYIITTLIIGSGLISWSNLLPASLPSTATTAVTTPPPAALIDLSNVTLIGTEKGFNIVDKSGISALNKDLSWVKDILIDKQGRVWEIDSSGLNVFDGQNWTYSQEPKGVYTLESLALDSKGRLWLGYFGGISVLDGGQWQNYSSENFGLGQYADSVKDVAVDSQDRVWVATAAGLAVLDGTGWTHYDETSGLTCNSLESIAAAPDGKIWLAHSYGVDVFDGRNWTFYGDKYDKNPQIKVSELLQTQALAIDNQGYIWAGTFGCGISFFNGSNWKTYNSRDYFHGGAVNSMYCDQTGRIWLGTDFGLVVYDGQNWLHYTQNSSNLLSNNIQVIFVTGSGPQTLPQPLPLKPGKVTGNYINNAQPVAGATAVICREANIFYTGDSPIEGDSYSATTDANGVFLIDNVPPNRYDLAVKTREGKWYILLSSVFVKDGETTDLGDLSIE